MTQSMKAARGAKLRLPLAMVVTAGLAVAGCAGNAPGTSPTAAPPPAVSSTPPAQPQPAVLTWAKSMCQTLHPAFDPLGAPPQLDFSNLAATQQAYITYLGNARTAAQQAIDRIPTITIPPVDNGQQVLDNAREQLVQLREDLDNALVKLKEANPNDLAATGLALGAAGNVLGALVNRAQVLGNLTVDPQLRAAIDQTPECQNLTSGTTATTSTNPPTGSSQPSR